MPLLPPNDPRFAGLTDFASVLPSAVVANGTLVPQFAAIRKSEFGGLLVDNGRKLAAHVGRNNAVTFGWPEQLEPQLDALISEALRTLPPAATRFVLDVGANILSKALQPVMDAVTDAITGIPILGWIAQAGLTVWRLVEEARRRAPTITGNRALAYDRDGDTDFCRRLLAEATDSDWTPLWLPPDGEWATVDLAFTSSGIADGKAWGQVTGAVEDVERIKRGLVPGVSSIAGYWQTPRKMPGSSRPAGAESLVALTQTLPAANNLAALLWTNAQRPGPQLGRIDYAKLRNAWHDYGDRAEAFVAAEKNDWLREQKRLAWSWYGDFGWRPYGVGPQHVDKAFRNPALQYLANAKIDVAQTRALQSLQTFAAAYVTADAPLVRQDSGIKAAWQRTRQSLLTSHNVHRVDVALVSDAAYRAAVVQAQQTVPVPQRTPTGAPSKPQRTPSSTEPEPSLPQQTGVVDLGDDDAGAGIVAGAAALLFLLFG